MNQTSLLTDTLTSPFAHGAYPSWVQDDILCVSICDAQVNIVVNPPLPSPAAGNLLVLKAAWTPSASLCGFQAEPLKAHKKTDKRSYVLSFFYTSSQMWEPPPVVRDELYHVKHHPPAVLGKLKVVKVYIPDQLPAMSDLISTGIPTWWRGVCWNGLSTHGPPDVPVRSDVRCSFGAQVSPHLVSSCWHIGSFYLSKDPWVYVQAYGITLSSVLTAKHDSTANFWPEIKLQQNDKKQTSNLQGYLLTGAAWAVDEGNKEMREEGGGGWAVCYRTARKGFEPLFA